MDLIMLKYKKKYLIAKKNILAVESRNDDRLLNVR